jgi:signal transduction histidine kinase
MVRRTARALAYVATGLWMGIGAFAWCVATTAIVAIVAITHLGLPAFLVLTAGTRRLAGWERRRAGWYLGRAILIPHRPVAATTLAGRAAQVAAQPATWRDLAWLWLQGPVGLGSFLVAAAPCAVAAAAIVAPAWAWAVPNPHAPAVPALLEGTWPGRLVLCAAGLAVAPGAMWLASAAAGLQARLAGAMLAPGSRQRLAERADRFATTRARVLDAQAAELRRIERDLHDGAQARIVAAGMTLALAERRVRAGPSGGEAIGDDLRLARRQLEDALAELRRLVRGIHPPILTDRGLREAISALAADSPLDVELHAGAGGRQAPAVESAAYFVVAEALANAAKHAAAEACTVEVALGDDGTLAVEVRDDGRGGADPAGPGLDGLRRRVEALDGVFTITSPLGGPTVLRAEFPCAS